MVFDISACLDIEFSKVIKKHAPDRKFLAFLFIFFFYFWTLFGSF